MCMLHIRVLILLIHAQSLGSGYGIRVCVACLRHSQSRCFYFYHYPIVLHDTDLFCRSTEFINDRLFFKFISSHAQMIARLPGR